MIPLFYTAYSVYPITYIKKKRMLKWKIIIQYYCKSILILPHLYRVWKRDLCLSIIKHKLKSNNEPSHPVRSWYWNYYSPFKWLFSFFKYCYYFFSMQMRLNQSAIVARECCLSCVVFLECTQVNNNWYTILACPRR